MKAARHFGVLRPDAELVLDYVDYLIIASGQLGRLPPEFSQLAGTGSMSELHSQWVAMLEGVQSGIQQVMADHYSSTVDNEKALKLYTPLISILQSDNRITPVYTTNYDSLVKSLCRSD